MFDYYIKFNDITPYEQLLLITIIIVVLLYIKFNPYDLLWCAKICQIPSVPVEGLFRLSTVMLGSAAFCF